MKSRELESTGEYCPKINESIAIRFRSALEKCYQHAESLHASDQVDELKDALQDYFDIVLELANARHAARGVILTLAMYKLIQPEQDVRRHKAEFEGGFSARGIDTEVTVPFLEQHSLPYNVETHWLTQTFSFAGPLEEDLVLKTNPKKLGPLTIKVVNLIENVGGQFFAEAVATLILAEMIEIRNKGRVALTKPKNLSVDQVIILLEKHLSYGYKTNTPRLPQLAIFAIYECLMDGVDRYSDYRLRPIERLKTANRKSGSVGDIDIEFNKQPIEAVEVKYQIPISKQHVSEAIEKIKTASVERYFILSTSGIKPEDVEDINRLRSNFLKSNGCEIIVNGVLSTIRYYLRLLRSTNDFINRYTECLEIDKDTDYEHKLAWNDICSKT